MGFDYQVNTKLVSIYGKKAKKQANSINFVCVNYLLPKQSKSVCENFNTPRLPVIFNIFSQA